MTTPEIIKLLKIWHRSSAPFFPDNLNNALKQAIKALEEKRDREKGEQK